MRKNEKRPGVLREPQGAGKNTWAIDNPYVATPRRIVNCFWLFVVLQFRNVIVDGIALIGWPKCPWLSRLVDRLTVLADALAEKSGVRA